MPFLSILHKPRTWARVTQDGGGELQARISLDGAMAAPRVAPEVH